MSRGLRSASKKVDGKTDNEDIDGDCSSNLTEAGRKTRPLSLIINF